MSSVELLLLLLLLACLCDDLRSIIAASSRACSTVADVSEGVCPSAPEAGASRELSFEPATSEPAVSAVVLCDPVACSRQVELRGTARPEPLPEQAAADSPAVLWEANRALPSLIVDLPLQRTWFRSLAEPEDMHASEDRPDGEAWHWEVSCDA